MSNFLYYLLAMNIIGFVIMGIDKRKAKRHNWRISENTLLMVAFLGGALGAGLGMQVFHHKTKHLKFVIGIPVFFILNIAMLWYLNRLL